MNGLSFILSKAATESRARRSKIEPRRPSLSVIVGTDMIENTSAYLLSAVGGSFVAGSVPVLTHKGTSENKLSGTRRPLQLRLANSFYR